MASRSEHLVERAAERLERFGLDGESGAFAPQPLPRPVELETPVNDPAHDPVREPVAPLRRATDAPEPGTPPEAPLKLGMAALEAAGLMLGGPRRSRISEEYQIFSTQVLRTLQAAPRGALPGNLLMITSTRPAEGKSFSAINLAASLARDLRTKTLLIDGDPKQNSMSVQLGIADRKGLFNLIGNPAPKVETLLVETAIEGMSILPIGTIAEAHGITRQLGAVIDRLARRFSDHVLIFDAPPSLATSDPSTLSSHVTQIIVVVEAEHTQRRELEHTLDLLRACPNIALMLNKMRFGAPNAFGAYSYYGA